MTTPRRGTSYRRYDNNYPLGSRQKPLFCSTCKTRVFKGTLTSFYTCGKCLEQALLKACPEALHKVDPRPVLEDPRYHLSNRPSRTSANKDNEWTIPKSLVKEGDESNDEMRLSPELITKRDAFSVDDHGQENQRKEKPFLFHATLDKDDFERRPPTSRGRPPCARKRERQPEPTQTRHWGKRKYDDDRITKDERNTREWMGDEFGLCSYPTDDIPPTLSSTSTMTTTTTTTMGYDPTTSTHHKKDSRSPVPPIDEVSIDEWARGLIEEDDISVVPSCDGNDSLPVDGELLREILEGGDDGEFLRDIIEGKF